VWNRPNVLTALRARAARGEDVPALQSMPIIDEGGYTAWAAFHALSGRRSGNGFGPNPISTSEIVYWMDLNEVTDPEQRLDYYYLVSVLDDEWLKIVSEQSEQSRRPPHGDHRRGRS
jgi:hypothetical protein